MPLEVIGQPSRIKFRLFPCIFLDEVPQKETILSRVTLLTGAWKGFNNSTVATMDDEKLT